VGHSRLFQTKILTIRSCTIFSTTKAYPVFLRFYRFRASLGKTLHSFLEKQITTGKLARCVVYSLSTTCAATFMALAPSPVLSQHLSHPVQQHVTTLLSSIQRARPSHHPRPALTQRENLTTTPHFANHARKSASFPTGLPCNLVPDVKLSWSGASRRQETLRGQELNPLPMLMQQTC
jgi:hypothetical protein